MKYFLTLTLYLYALAFLPFTTLAQVIPGDLNNFITTWDTENPGTTANNQIRIPEYRRRLQLRRVLGVPH